VAGPAAGGRLHRVGSLTLRGHVYPVAGPHSFRGAIGLFGAPRNGGRRHEGFDIVARCGTPIVAARSGTVKRRRYDPVLYGNYMIVRGGHERVEYWYAHMRAPGRVREGGYVRTGQRLGDVGATGNARTVGCHLHFEMHGAGGPFDPLPRLRRWDAR
jgi:murein DD-endopeptidase MepM/ murein hydrolase activator NlpD